MTGSLWAAVPVKGLAGAKTRLGPSLPAADRGRLVQSWLGRLLGVLCAAPGLDRVVVVSPDPGLLDLATRAGAAAIEQGPGGDLNGAVGMVAEAAASAGAAGLLVLPVDLPLVDVADIAALLAAARTLGSPGVVVAGDRSGMGTNALFMAPPGVLTPAFGPGSLAAHQQAARSAGIPFRRLDRPRLAFDVDTPADLSELDARSGSGARAAGEAP